MKHTPKHALHPAETAPRSAVKGGKRRPKGHGQPIAAVDGTKVRQKQKATDKRFARY